MRHRKNLFALNSLLKDKAYVDWTNWKNRECKGLCEFFVQKNFCKKFKTDKDQFLEFTRVVNDFYANKEKMLKAIINSSPGLKKFLQIHSVFKVDTFGEDGDWLSKEMARILFVTDDDLADIFKDEQLPEEVKAAMAKLSELELEPVGFEKDNVRIEYDFWGFGGPVKFIDTDWESVNKKVVDVPTYLSQFQNIAAYKPVGPVNAQLYDDDLPF